MEKENDENDENDEEAKFKRIELCWKVHSKKSLAYLLGFRKFRNLFELVLGDFLAEMQLNFFVPKIREVKRILEKYQVMGLSEAVLREVRLPMLPPTPGNMLVYLSGFHMIYSKLTQF